MNEQIMQQEWFFDLEGRLHGALETGQSSKTIKWVWVPTEQVLLTSAFVPGKKSSEWRAALPFVLEERLTQPVESLHFAVYHRETEPDELGHTHVAVVSKLQMQQWLDELKAYELEHVALIPSCFQLAYQNESTPVWYYRQQEGHRLMRTGPFSGGLVSETLAEQLITLEQVTQPDLVWHPAFASEQSLTQLKVFDLRQGDYKPIAEENPHWKKWRGVVFLIVLMAIVGLGHTVWQTHQAEKEAKILQQQTQALFKKMFPKTKRIVNIRAQTKTHLKGHDGVSLTDGPALLMKKLESKLVPFVKQKQIEFISASWRKQKLVVVVKAKDTTRLEKMVADAQPIFQGKIELKLKNVTSQNVEAEIHVSDG